VARRSLPPFSVLDRYVLGEFLRYYVLALGGFVGFVLLFDAFEKIDTFIDHEASWGEIGRYYWNALPFRTLVVAPVAPLLATFLCLGTMTRFREVVSVQSAGLSLYRLFFPLYVVGVLIAGASFVVSEYVMPPANRRAREILRVEIQGRTQRNLGSRPNVTYLGRDNRTFVIRRYDVPRETMMEPSIQEFEDDRLVRRLDAAKATWRDGAWVLESGTERRFDAGGRETAAAFDTLRLVTPETPADFSKEEAAPDEMSYFELRKYTERVRESGSTVQAYLTELHLRIAFPFSNVVVILIASSLAVQMRRGGIALGFGMSLAIAFAYWCLIRAGQVLGNNGTLPPLVGAWIGNLAFFGLGTFLLVRTPK
jgi:lipopolysaccharide export system permease protein